MQGASKEEILPGAIAALLGKCLLQSLPEVCPFFFVTIKPRVE